MKTTQLFTSLLAALLCLASCGDEDKPQSGDFGEIQVPDISQLEQTADSEASQSPSAVTFTTQGPWSSTITATRAEAPAWISISPDRGDAAGSYTIRITLEPNTGDEARSATISILCGSSQCDINVTQEALYEEPSERQPNGRLARITEYEDDRTESVTIFTYDEERRITSAVIYQDAACTRKTESWEFSYPLYSASEMTVTETHYDRTPAYGYVWECEGGFHSPNGAIIEYATGTSMVDPDDVRYFIYEYDKNGLIRVDKRYYVTGSAIGIPDSEGEEIYTYGSEYNCSQIERRLQDGTQGSQHFTYDEQVGKRSESHYYERLFSGGSSASLFDPGLYVISERDMLRFLGFYRNESVLLPVKVSTTWGNGTVTENISYEYKNLDGWKIGEMIDGMEITVRSDSKTTKRYVLTFEGI